MRPSNVRKYSNKVSIISIDKDIPQLKFSEGQQFFTETLFMISERNPTCQDFDQKADLLPEFVEKTTKFLQNLVNFCKLFFKMEVIEKTFQYFVASHQPIRKSAFDISLSLQIGCCFAFDTL
jgi:hypothetical protein